MEIKSGDKTYQIRHFNKHNFYNNSVSKVNEYDEEIFENINFILDLLAANLQEITEWLDGKEFEAFGYLYRQSHKQLLETFFLAKELGFDSAVNNILPKIIGNILADTKNVEDLFADIIS